MVPQEKKLVLVVEDDKDIRAAVGEVLEEAGIAYLTATNGAEALAMLQAGTRPSLILLDLMMPVMDGFTFRDEQLKHGEWSGIPVVIMSADGNIGAKKDRMGQAAYLKKPIDIYDLINMVEKHLA
jgi:CheY-like chemotaxis protein